MEDQLRCQREMELARKKDLKKMRKAFSRNIVEDDFESTESRKVTCRRAEKMFRHMSEYVCYGNILAASDVPFLRANGIRSVLWMCTPEEEALANVQQPATVDFEKIYIRRCDGTKKRDADLRAAVENAVACINRSVREGKKIFVFCTTGYVRTATVMVAYLMKTNLMTTKEAFDHAFRMNDKNLLITEDYLTYLNTDLQMEVKRTLYTTVDVDCLFRMTEGR